MKIGTTELLLVLLVVVILFGPTQIPKLAKMFGEAIKNFRNGLNGEEAKKDAAVTEETKADTKEQA